jgi:hypothetical protein
LIIEEKTNWGRHLHPEMDVTKTDKKEKSIKEERSLALAHG